MLDPFLLILVIGDTVSLICLLSPNIFIRVTDYLLFDRLDIEIEEPPPLRILDLICHNELCRAMGYDESHQVKIKWYQRILCQIVDLGEYSVAAPKCA